MHKSISGLLLIAITICSCANKYKAYRSNYQFKSVDGKPVYSQLDYWAAHPWKWDPSDSLPAPLKNEKRDSLADVFFLYPTSYTKKLNAGNQNALIDDYLINAKTDYTSILYQASVFNQESRIFAPRYRQGHIKNFFRNDRDSAARIFELAYQDIKAAFEYYLQQWNDGRPIIIASHSQGSMLAERLLSEFFDGKKLQQQLVAAYVLGWPVPKEYFTSLKMCEDSLQTGCICSWRTLRKGFVPAYLKQERGNSYVTNPLSWTTDGSYVARDRHKGSILLNFNKIYYRTTDARTSNGLLYVKKPTFPGGFFYFTRNYHVGDFNLFYMNIRQNISLRIKQFNLKKGIDTAN